MEEVKEVILEEGQLPDINSIVTQMFGDETDPRSNAYVRKLYRPKIHWWRMILYLLALSGMVAGTVLVMGGIHCPVWQCVVGALLVCLICLMLTANTWLCSPSGCISAMPPTRCGTNAGLNLPAPSI